MNTNKKELEIIRKKHNLSLILLHGSQVDRQIHDKSDVDIAVTRNDRNVDLQKLALLADLNGALSTDKVDLTDITNADPLLLYSVASSSELLSGNIKEYDRLKKIAFHKYSDYQPFLKMESDFVKERIKSYVTT